MILPTISILLLCVTTVKCGRVMSPSPFYIPSQEELDINCTRNCLVEKCLISDQTDCRRFITCKRNPIGLNSLYRGTLQLCAFGTHWAGLQEHLTCDLIQNVKCDINYCAGRPLGSNYPHLADNCKTYWRCGDKGPEPKCCKDGEYFDKMELRCVKERGTSMCNDVCPVKKDVCIVKGVETEYFDDKNCRTYWNCNNKLPHPTCCKEPGHGYNRTTGMCQNDGCAGECPPEYLPDICLTGISGYKLHDNSCRTYMKCGPGGVAIRSCCLHGFYYDQATRTCLVKNPDLPMSCSDDCYGYNEMCTLDPGPTPNSFLNNGIQVNCSGSMVFSLKDCTCVGAKKTAEMPEKVRQQRCNMEVDIIFNPDGLSRLGTQRVQVGNRGLMLPGVTYNQSATIAFDGTNYYRVMYFKQPFPKLYTNLVYQPNDAASSGKRILLSNCRKMSSGGPSYEVFLENGRVKFILVTDVLVSGELVFSPVSLSLRYQPNVWNRLRIIYDGTNVQMLNENLDPNGSVPSEAISAELTGEVSMAFEGLDIGKCHDDLHPDTRVLGFTGSIARLQFTKYPCQEILNSFTMAASNAVDAGAGVNNLSPA